MARGGYNTTDSPEPKDNKPKKWPMGVFRTVGHTWKSKNLFILFPSLVSSADIAADVRIKESSALDIGTMWRLELRLE